MNLPLSIVSRRGPSVLLSFSLAAGLAVTPRGGWARQPRDTSATATFVESIDDLLRAEKHDDAARECIEFFPADEALVDFTEHGFNATIKCAAHLTDEFKRDPLRFEYLTTARRLILGLLKASLDDISEQERKLASMQRDRQGLRLAYLALALPEKDEQSGLCRCALAAKRRREQLGGSNDAFAAEIYRPYREAIDTCARLLEHDGETGPSPIEMAQCERPPSVEEPLAEAAIEPDAKPVPARPPSRPSTVQERPAPPPSEVISSRATRTYAIWKPVTTWGLGAAVSATGLALLISAANGVAIANRFVDGTPSAAEAAWIAEEVPRRQSDMRIAGGIVLGTGVLTAVVGATVHAVLAKRSRVATRKSRVHMHAFKSWGVRF